MTVKEYSDMIDSQGGHLEGLDLLCAYLASEIFDYVSYDDDLDIEMGKKLYKTVDAILKKEQGKLVESDFYEDYIVCLNIMQLNCEKISWGTSIRFPWFEYDEEGYWSKEDYLEMVKIHDEIEEILNEQSRT